MYTPLLELGLCCHCPSQIEAQLAHTDLDDGWDCNPSPAAQLMNEPSLSIRSEKAQLRESKDMSSCNAGDSLAQR